MTSIIIAVYNAERYIESCVQSILAQTESDWELFIVDDGSTDSTGARATALADSDARICYVRQDNQGAAAARNHGMALARGEFIMFVDGDDCLRPDILRRLLDRADAEADIVCCSCATFREDTDDEFHCHFYPEDFEARSIEEREKLYLQLLDLRLFQKVSRRTGIGVPWGKLYRAEMLQRNGLHFPSLRRMQDNIFNMYAFACARKIIYLDEPLYRYRADHIATTRVSPENRRAVLEAREEFFAQHPQYFTEAVQREFYYEKMRYLGTSLKTYAATLPRKEALTAAKALCKAPVYAHFLRLKPCWNVPIRYRLLIILAVLGWYRLLLALAKAKAAALQSESTTN